MADAEKTTVGLADDHSGHSEWTILGTDSGSLGCAQIAVAEASLAHPLVILWAVAVLELELRGLMLWEDHLPKSGLLACHDTDCD